MKVMGRARVQLLLVGSGKTKNPTRVGVGLGGGDSGGSRPLFAQCAYHHRRRSDPCHQTRLADAMTLAVRFAVARTEQFIARRDEERSLRRQEKISRTTASRPLVCLQQFAGASQERPVARR